MYKYNVPKSLAECPGLLCVCFVCSFQGCTCKQNTVSPVYDSLPLKFSCVTCAKQNHMLWSGRAGLTTWTYMQCSHGMVRTTVFAVKCFFFLLFAFECHFLKLRWRSDYSSLINVLSTGLLLRIFRRSVIKAQLFLWR